MEPFRLSPARTAVFPILLAIALIAVLAPSAGADYVRIGSFSGPGEGDGQLGLTPGRAALEPSTGNLFVVDPEADRVQVFKPGPFPSSMATYLTQFGAGTLENPWGIAVAEEGGQTKVYVADSGHSRIVKFDSDEAATPTFTIDPGFTSPAIGSGADQIENFQSAIALAPNGDIWVTDPGAGLVKRFDPTGAHVAGSNIDGSTSGASFIEPIDVAVNSTGDLYVIDADGPVGGEPKSGHSRALRFGSDGAFKTQLGPITNDTAAVVAVNLADDSVLVSGFQDNVNVNAHPTLHMFDALNSPVTNLPVDSQYSEVTGLVFDPSGPKLWAVLGAGFWGGGPWGAPNIAVYPDVYKLTVETPGVGKGDVDADTGGIINCANGGACVDFYYEGTYTLTASEVPYSFFVEWQDCDTVSPDGTECTITMGGAAQTVRAIFERYKQPLEASIGGTGEGRVTAKPGPISNCGASGGICEGLYNEASSVTLTATPEESSVFSGWSGACTNETGSCVVSVDAPTSVTALFTRKREINVQRSGTGSGGVESAPGGIECGAKCTGFYPEGEQVSLVATPADDSHFVGWSGGGCSGAGACVVTVAATPTLVTAQFELNKPLVTTASGASHVGQRTGTVFGSVNPGGTQILDCHISYGTTVAYGSQVPCSPSGVRGRSPVNVGATLRGLSPSTTYHFRVVATNRGGTEFGTSETFTTLPDTCDSNEALCPPRLVAPPAEPRKVGCRKGFVKKKGRCVKKKKRSNRRSKRHRKAGRHG
jgi:sugar lactone lactonase YvrE